MKPNMRSRQPPIFSASSTYIVWGYLPLTYFCWIFPLKEEKGLAKSVWDFSGVTLISVVSLTLRRLFQRYRWHRGNCFSGVNDIAEIILAVSMTPLRLFQQCQWHQWSSAKKNSVVDVPMNFFTLPSLWFQRCQWHCWNRFSGVNGTAEIVSALSMTPLN
jgi:hypothetical protein